jgi:hypothetical protein
MTTNRPFRLYLVFSVIMLLAAFCYARADGQTWTQVPGVPITKVQDQIFDRNGCLWISATDPNSPGVWRSNNCGSKIESTSWTRMYNDTAGKMILNAAGEVVVETHNIADMPIVRFVNNLTPSLTAAKARWRNIVLHGATGTIYAQSATCEVWTSKDNGATFSLMASEPPYTHGNCFGALGVRQSDGHIFVGDEAQGGYEWNGSTWNSTGSTPNANCVFFAPKGDVWMCDSNNNPRKWDGATTWNPIAIWPQHTLRAHSFLVNGSDWYAAAKDYQANTGPYVFKSSDGGATWVNDSAGLPSATSGQGNDFAVGPDGYLYFGTDDFAGGIYRKALAAVPPPPPPPPPPPTPISTTSTQGVWIGGADVQMPNGHWFRSGTNFENDIPVLADGLYLVTMRFEESASTVKLGDRRINVSINDQPVQQNFDMLSLGPMGTQISRTVAVWLQAGTAFVKFSAANSLFLARSSGVAITLLPQSASSTAIEFRTCSGSGQVGGGTGFDCQGMQSVQITKPDGTVLGPYVITPVQWDSKWTKTIATFTIPQNDAIPGVIWPHYVFDAVHASACEPHIAPELTVNGKPRLFTRRTCNFFVTGDLAPGDSIAVAWSDPFVTAQTMLSVVKADQWR